MKTRISIWYLMHNDDDDNPRLYDGYVSVLNVTTEDKSSDGEICEDMFRMLNGSSPTGKGNPLFGKEQQDYIRAYNTHTSMSVGDVIGLFSEGVQRRYVCASMGFKRCTDKGIPIDGSEVGISVKVSDLEEASCL